MQRINLEGDETPHLYSTLVQHSDLRHVGSNTSSHSDLYVTVQVWAGSKPLTVPVQTAYKAFRSERKYAIQTQYTRKRLVFG